MEPGAIHWQEMADAAIARLGPDHPDTLTNRSNLAHWQTAVGDPGSS